MGFRVFTTFLLFVSASASAQTSPVRPAQTPNPDADSEITDLLLQESLLPNLDARVEFVSAQFIGRPYFEGGPLGEGPSGKYDQDPLYRTDGFDCTTFVETVMSIARSTSLENFAIQQNQIRYKDGVIDFTQRNHFVEIDWNPNNIAAGIFTDISSLVASPEQVGFSDRVISKKNWYASLPANMIQLLNSVSIDLIALLDSLHAEGAAFPDVNSHLAYVKKEALLAIQNKLPTPAVLNIVRNEPVDGSTTLYAQVTHQVLLFSKDRNLRVRQDSSKTENMKVIDQPFAEFVQDQLASPSTVGVNILKALDP
jgi:hypothetical protein